MQKRKNGPLGLYGVSVAVVILSALSSGFSAHAANASRWRLTIPIPGTYAIPSGNFYSSPYAIATFADATATCNYVGVQATDSSINQRLYDVDALFHTSSTITTTTNTVLEGCYQIGRYTDGYPPLMTMTESYDFETGATATSTPGLQTGWV